MRQYQFALTLLAAAAIAGCGGHDRASVPVSSGTTQPVKVKFNSQVTFGDNLSDVGTYAVGAVAAAKGGQFNINGSGSGELTGKNWTEIIASQLGLPAPCAAQTGLRGTLPDTNVAVVNRAGCFGYAQGGARITDSAGIGSTSSLGLLTVPVSTQIQNHLSAVGGSFSGTEVVFVLAGGNDVWAQVNNLNAGASTAGQAAGAAESARVQAATYVSALVTGLAKNATDPQAAAQAISAAITAENARPGHTDQTVVGAAVATAAAQPGNSGVSSPAVYGPAVALAQTTAATAAQTAGATAAAKAAADYFTANSPQTVTEMGRLGTELGNLVKNQIIAKGAKYVVVVNLPDISLTPKALASGVSDAQRSLMKSMVTTFNDQLRQSVANVSQVLFTDAYAASADQVANAGTYGLTNVKDVACDLSPAKNQFGTALGCTTANLISGDVSHYLFSDGSNLTPFGYLLLARLVAKDMTAKNWL